jgi:AtzE family amidohydrolase
VIQKVPSATELAAAIRSGKTTASGAVEDALNRISTFNPTLNAFTRVFAEEALQLAREVDGAIARGCDMGALAGVPFAVKDLFDVKGQITTAGSIILSQAPAASCDAVAVARLRDAGGILVGTLNMDEFAYGFVTQNRHFGTTFNPHDTTRFSGGSSGGSAAAVAAGMVALTLGSDTNGSVRVPSSLCGVFGLRPTHDAIPLDGVFPFIDRLDTVGPFARSVEDLRTAFAVLSGRPQASPNGDTLRAARLDGWFRNGADPGGLAELDAAAQILGAHEFVNLPLAALGRSAGFLMTAFEGGRRHLDNLRQRPMDFDPATRDRLIAGALLPSEVLEDAERAAALSIDELNAALKQFDVLIALATPSSAPKITDGTLLLGEKVVPARANLGLYAQPISLSGVPVLTVPLARPGRLPFGVQLIAARGRESILFDAADRLVAAGAVAFSWPPLLEVAA